jgi:glutamine---fructose-6-phosphate transaminase (isomerizing)
VGEEHEPGSYLKATLAGQPRELERILSDGESAARAAKRLAGCSRVLLAGTGTSYHGALAGQYMLRSAGVDAWAVRAFELAVYPPPLRDDDGLILLSHRGTKLYSRQALDMFAKTIAKKSDRWIVITGLGSPLEGPGVLTTVEQERSPVHTASHTGAMLRIAQVASEIGRPSWKGQLSGLPDLVRQAIATGDSVAVQTDDVELRPVTHFVGGGPARATAYEGALKLREASHLVSAEGHDVEGILHGPLVSIQPGTPVVLIKQPGPSLQRIEEVESALREISARVLSFPPPSGLDEVLAPIVNVVPLQLLAYHASRRLGVDADSFRRDEKEYAAAQAKFTL